MSKNEIALVEVRVLEGKEENLNVGEIKMAFRRYLCKPSGVCGVAQL